MSVGTAKALRLLSARLSPHTIVTRSKPVKARIRLAPPSRRAWPWLFERPEISPPTVPNASPYAAGRGHRFQKHATVAELEGDIEQVGIVRQTNRISPANARRPAEAREKVAKVVQSLAVDEAAERLIDQRDVRFAEQPVHILGCAQDDPVERQFEEIARGLNPRDFLRLRLDSGSAVNSSTLVIGPPASEPVNI